MPKRICAFTLVELVVTVVIVSVLAGFALVKYSNVREKALSAEAYAVLADIVAAENGYYVEYGNYTTTWANLDRYSAAPTSGSFNYSLGATYGRATSTKGGKNYCMGFSGGGAITCP
jgi:prepilin-type N-terminal cleavage/methylation domain-containing protein